MFESEPDLKNCSGVSGRFLTALKGVLAPLKLDSSVNIVPFLGSSSEFAVIFAFFRAVEYSNNEKFIKYKGDYTRTI